MKTEVPVGEDNINQHMKMIMLQKCYQSWYKSNHHHMEPFEGNLLDFTYFMSMFQESVEKKIDDPREG